MDSCTATSIDNIGHRLLKYAAPVIADISYIPAHLLSQKFEEANVSPLHKNRPNDDVYNYRPIPILPVLSKVFEKHAHD